MWFIYELFRSRKKATRETVQKTIAARRGCGWLGRGLAEGVARLRRISRSRIVQRVCENEKREKNV